MTASRSRPGEPAGRARALVLQLRGITKRFGDLLANDAIELAVRRGEILALLGENGAGKTTLMSILFGHYVADAGRSPMPRALHAAARLAACGPGGRHRHGAPAFRARPVSPCWRTSCSAPSLLELAPDRPRARAKARRADGRGRARGPPDAPVGGLSVGERQRIEILKALYRDIRVLILDEPTAVLTPQEAERLFATLERLAAGGLVDHLHQPQARRGDAAVADRVAVLRGGRKVAEFATDATTPAAIAEAMVGRAARSPDASPGPRGRWCWSSRASTCRWRAGASATGLS